MWTFSKVQIKNGLDLNRLAHAIPTNAYAEHDAIWRLLSVAQDQRRDFLFRREEQAQRPTFYLLAPREPVDPAGLWSIQSKPYAPQLAEGQRLAFSLRANPTRTRKASDDPDDKRRSRDDVVMQAKHQEAEREPDPTRRASQAELVQRAGPKWLAERAERCGFALEELLVDGYFQHRFHKRGQKEAIRISTLDYQGILRITDMAAFERALYQGIGPAKGFGCGMLLIRRA
jgi:CRISPR system Cascade subunit CasE